MKTVLSYCFVIISLSSSAQNYRCLQPASKNYFINGDGYVRGVRIDSMHTSGAGTTYYPYRSSRISNYLAVIRYDTMGASWLGKNIVERPDGTFLFDNLWDTVVVRTQANLGDSWIFYNDTTNIYYTARITAEDTMTVLGAIDSVKKISITAYRSGVINSDDPVNNFQIILSKNNGFVQVFDLFTFPYHHPGVVSATPSDSTSIRYIDYYLDVLLGNVGGCDLGCFDIAPDTANSIFHLFAFHNPTLMEIYDFSIGDVFESEFVAEDGLYVTYTLDSVTSKTVTSSMVSSSGRGHSMTIISNPGTLPLIRDTTYSVGPFYSGGDTNLLVSRMPEEWNSELLHYFPAKTFQPTCNPARYELDVDYRGGGFGYNGIAMIPSYSYATYSIGYGEIASSTFIAYGPSSQSLRDIFYDKDSTACGGIVPVSPTMVSSVNLRSFIQILPNPASDHISVTTGNLFNPNTSVSIYDIIGNCVFRSTSDLQNELIINTSSFAGGWYIVIVRDSTGILGREKVLLTH